MIAVTGQGVVSSLGVGIGPLRRAVLDGTTGITEAASDDLPQRYARLVQFDLEARLSECVDPETTHRIMRTSGRSSPLGRSGVLAAVQAWSESGATERVDPSRVAVVGTGTNLMSASAHDAYERYRGKLRFASPKLAVDLLDTSLLAHVTAALAHRGVGVQVGAASASGNAAIIHATRLIRAGEVDACLVVGATALPSPMELHAMANTGALAWTGTSVPMSASRQGFVPGEAAVAIVLEPAESVADAHGYIRGWAERMHPTAGPEPEVGSEIEVMAAAVRAAGRQPQDVAYINAHATGSKEGDSVELAAAEEVFKDNLSKPWINSTKSLTGHCLATAGLVELVVTLVQLRCGALHPTVGLTDPVETQLRHPGQGTVIPTDALALSNGFGFGGFNTSIAVTGART